MAEERIGQVRGATHAVDASVGLVNHLGQGRARETGQLHALEAGPQAFDGLSLVDCWRPLHSQPPGPGSPRLNLPVEPGVHPGRDALVCWAALLQESLPPRAWSRVHPANPMPAASSPGGAARRRTRPFRLRRSRRPIRSLQGPGEKRTRGHRGGAWSPQRGRTEQDQLGGPEYVPSDPDPVDPNSGAEPVQRRHTDVTPERR